MSDKSPQIEILNALRDPKATGLGDPRIVAAQANRLASSISDVAAQILTTSEKD